MRQTTSFQMACLFHLFKIYSIVVHLFPLFENRKVNWMLPGVDAMRRYCRLYVDFIIYFACLHCCSSDGCSNPREWSIWIWCMACHLCIWIGHSPQTTDCICNAALMIYAHLMMHAVRRANWQMHKRIVIHTSYIISGNGVYFNDICKYYEIITYGLRTICLKDYKAVLNSWSQSK